MEILFTTISSLTGGLVTDIKTLMVAMLSIAFICMAFDLIRDALENSIAERQFTASGKKLGMTDIDINEEKDRIRFETAKNRYRSRL